MNTLDYVQILREQLQLRSVHERMGWKFFNWTSYAYWNDGICVQRKARLTRASMSVFRLWYIYGNILIILKAA